MPRAVHKTKGSKVFQEDERKKQRKAGSQARRASGSHHEQGGSQGALPAVFQQGAVMLGVRLLHRGGAKVGLLDKSQSHCH